MTPPALAALIQAEVWSPSAASQGLAVVANVIKILEGLVIAFGAFQLWTNRQERRDSERKAALLARKAANYQAWQVVNSAFGKGGSGGRVDALQDLVANNVSLAGVKLDGAWLEGVALPSALLHHASLRETVLVGADFGQANLERADLSGSQLEGASFRGAFLRRANLAGASLGTTDLSGADLGELRGWREIASISYANVRGVRNAPTGFLEWALANGAVDGDQPLTETLSRGFSKEFRSV